MKKIISITLVVLSLIMVLSSAFAAVKDTQAFYSTSDAANPKVYQYPNLSSATYAITKDFYLLCDFEPGVDAHWMRVRRTDGQQYVGYMPLKDVYITNAALCGAYFGVGTLQKGDTGTAIGWLRAFLKEIGFNISISTTFDAAESAVKIFQASRGIDDDGLVGPATKKQLIAAIPSIADCIDRVVE